MELLHRPHHDGSELYVPGRTPGLGGSAAVRLRVPAGCPIGVDAVAVRCLRDGEPHVVRAEVDERTATDTWWRAELPVANPAVRYRFLLTGGDRTYAWLNGTGLHGHDIPDDDDFVLSTDPGGPDWHLSTVVYQVFPDRFASSGAERTPPGWAQRRPWDALPVGRGPTTPFEWFGGDLPGVEARLGHLEQLGVGALYLTPVFPAGSTHRYDAASFDEVDPLLGGDEALRSLARAAHARGIRVIGDLTTNHCGIGHPWFRTARDDAAAPEREFFFFDGSYRHGYEAWLGVHTLPKLDWRSHELRRRMAAIVRRWMAPGGAGTPGGPGDSGLDGWRIDVANMTGRHLAVDANGEAARLLREAVGEARADGLLIAEHGHDYRSDLQGFGWQGVMDYMGFSRPVWQWLRRPDLTDDLRRGFMGLPVAMPRLGGPAAVAGTLAFRAGRPWHTVLHSWNILDSHDTPRFLGIAGTRERVLAGAGLQMALPGVPMVFAGAEIGMEGAWGEDARRPFPWHRPESWDAATLDEYRRLIALRRSSDALARGGMRWVHVGDDALCWLRETRAERLLCLATRVPLDAAAALRVPLGALGARGLAPVHGGAAGDVRIEGGSALLPADGPAFHAWRVE